MFDEKGGQGQIVITEADLIEIGRQRGKREGAVESTRLGRILNPGVDPEKLARVAGRQGLLGQGVKMMAADTVTAIADAAKGETQEFAGAVLAGVFAPVTRGIQERGAVKIAAMEARFERDKKALVDSEIQRQDDEREGRLDREFLKKQRQVARQNKMDALTRRGVNVVTGAVASVLGGLRIGKFRRAGEEAGNGGEQENG